MSLNTPGIKSILDELKDIKRTLDINNHNIVDNTFKEINKANLEVRINKYESITHQFKNTVETLLIDPHKNISRIVESAVKFIEANKKQIFKIFDISRKTFKKNYNDFKSKKKLEFCLDLIKSVFTIDNINFVIDLINHFVEIFFNGKTKTIPFKINTLSLLR